MATTAALLLPWSDTYSVNIGIIDMQHKNLVGMINDLHQAMVQGHGREKLGTILADLVKYTKVHFSTEETFMESHHYPDYTAHKAEHDKLAKIVLDFQARFQKSQVGISIEVMNFLKDWLKNHILVSDKKYGPFLNSKGLH
jgi:hemerythrin-like metal-binding protein